MDIAAALRAKSFFEFDNASTAPLHGFQDAGDYYGRASSLSFLGRITTPVLCINAEDDPFVPREVVERARAAASSSIDFRVTRGGGHTGFIAGSLPWKAVYWAEELMVEWLVQSTA